MKRILVIGVCGAGKSTLALKMRHKIGLPVIHLDQHYWKPGWIESSSDEWRSKVSQLVSGDEWIMDGNYVSTFDIRLPRADTVVYLDFSTPIALARVIRRTIQSHGQVRPDMANGCPERFNWESLQFVWTFHRLHRPKVEAALSKIGPHQKLFRLKTPSQAEAFLQALTE